MLAADGTNAAHEMKRIRHAPRTARLTGYLSIGSMRKWVDVRKWPYCDITGRSAEVCFWVLTGPHLLTLEFFAF